MVMRQFDICRLRRARSKGPILLVVILQSDQLAELSTRLAAPLLAAGSFPDRFKHNPTVAFEGETYAIAVEQLGMVRINEMTVVGSASVEEYRIKRALDIVFFGS